MANRSISGIASLALSSWLMASVSLLISVFCFARLQKDEMVNSSLRVTVRVFNYAGASLETWKSAQIIATRIFNHAGIEPIWMTCSLSSDGQFLVQDCAATPPPDDIILRLVPVSKASRAQFGSRTLGISALSESSTPASASVFYDRVEELAKGGAAPVAVILAHAAAHEIGHLLLGTKSDSSRGLMCGRWNRSSLALAKDGQLNFLPGEIVSIRRELRRRSGAPVSKHPEVAGILTDRLTGSELEVWGPIMQIVPANDMDGWRVRPKLFQLYQQTATGRRNQRPDGFIPFAGQETKEPHSAKDYFERGLARAHAGDIDGAIDDYTNAIALNSHTRAPKRVKHPKSNLEDKAQPVLYENFLVIDECNALAYYNIGTLLMAQGRLTEALHSLSKAIRIQPRFGPAFNNRGYVKNLMGDVDGASRDFDRSVQLDPKNPVMYFNRGVFRLEAQDFAGAIADYTRAIEIDPRLDKAYHDRGRAYMAQGKLDEAYRDFNMAIELDPGTYAAYGNRGLVRILQGRDTEAEADFAHYLRYAGDKKDILEGLVKKARESRHANGVKASGNLPAIAP